MTAAIEVENLSKEYGTLHAVDGISFRVPVGAVFAFLGPNGAGKTTTVEILEGLRRRGGGTVTVLGLDPWTDGRRLHPRIGVIPQEFRFFDKITPREAIQYYAALFDQKVDVDRLLERVVLSDKATDRFETLSGGQKQKLGLALALVSNPELLFLDEPTTGLDPQARRAIRDVIRSLHSEGKTIFLTTHYLEEAELLADQVAIIHHGRIIADGTSSAIISQFGHPPRLRLEGSAALAEILRRTVARPVTFNEGMIDVEIRTSDDVLPVLTEAQASGLPWSNPTTVRDSLEDVFVRLVGEMDEGEVRAPPLPAGPGSAR
ncbi:MAG: ABC transporter ATP-binding protein [Thermoplasmata archaeon]